MITRFAIVWLPLFIMMEMLAGKCLWEGFTQWSRIETVFLYCVKEDEEKNKEHTNMYPYLYV